ncbi:uncharacterized protein TNCV_2162271 [Trichonephila clavipes]|nr:uncharacterized protein TNCV_2162271 [Trichonephila clavipes]
MAGYQDVSEFERSVIVGAREVGDSFSDVAMKFGFSHPSVSRVYCEYREHGLDTTLTSDRYVTILSAHLPHSCPLCIPMDLRNFSWTMRYPTRPELLDIVSRSHLLNLNTSGGLQNAQT